MPHMNEVLELLKIANDYLVQLDGMLMDQDCYNIELQNLGQKIEKTLKEWEILKVGHLART